MSTNETHPTWEDTIRGYFTEPPWLGADGKKIAAGWNEQMSGLFHMDLTDLPTVRSWALTIYYHLHSKSMPLTSDERQHFPDDVLESFREWVNDGCRETASDPIDWADRIPRPKPRPTPVLVRKNINELTDDELLGFRLAVIRLGAQDRAPDGDWSSIEWQRIASIHTDWCLHYQEAFLLWHRAYLLYMEQLLGVPIPYWNWMSPDIGVDGHPDAGLPRAFIDETFIDDEGRQRPNPLRYAIARRGQSKACATAESTPVSDPCHPYTAAHAVVSGDECAYVHRNPALYTTGDDHRAERECLLDQLVGYQRQVQHAMGWPSFSTPEHGGYPWANIPTFPAPDRCYTYRCDFDGRYEQPHDNYHGWVGPDMADNTYTAFDPVFWSHHSNIDRMFELWLRAHPDTQFTVGFPLRPFVGGAEIDIELADPRPFVYTNIGDLACDSRRIGYDYSPARDVPAIPPPTGASLHVAFDGVRCTDDSYAIDVFANATEEQHRRATSDNPHYVGRFMRVGMGTEDTNQRCIAHGVTRVMNADHVVDALGLSPGDPVELTTRVVHHTTGAVLTTADCDALPGFHCDPCWGERPDVPAGGDDIHPDDDRSSNGCGHCDDR